MKVDFLKPEFIEGASLSLLEAYANQYPAAQRIPVPVDDIVECHLKLDFGFANLNATASTTDVLGALWFDENKVQIDESLDPFEFPRQEGRYRFTVAHECGHWVLHRRYFLGRGAQGVLFESEPEPSIICRSSEKSVPIEWQADTFASYLLMPRDALFEAWESKFGSLKPYMAANEIIDISARRGDASDSVPTVQIAREMASIFKVSGQAMQIRLIRLGLIQQDIRGGVLNFPE